MIEVLTVVGFALFCGVWVFVQRASGRQGGSCGACGSGSCSRGDAPEAGGCQRRS